MDLDPDIAAADWLDLERIRVQTYRDDVAGYFERQMAIALAEKYFTTSTATDPATIQADAVADGKRFQAALTEALRIVAAIP